MKIRYLKILLLLIEDIFFFEVNTKYISSCVLKTSEFSQVRSTSENFDAFNTQDEIYLGDNCIQMFHWGRYIVRYMVRNFVLL